MVYKNEINAMVVDGLHGIYCPQVFALTVNHEIFPNISNESWNILKAGPDHEDYWDVWHHIEGCEYSVGGGLIRQEDGDIWIVYEEQD